VNKKAKLNYSTITGLRITQKKKTKGVKRRGDTQSSSQAAYLGNATNQKHMA
jgi:hypothetical protein